MSSLNEEYRQIEWWIDLDAGDRAIRLYFNRINPEISEATGDERKNQKTSTGKK